MSKPLDKTYRGFCLKFPPSSHYLPSTSPPQLFELKFHKCPLTPTAFLKNQAANRLQIVFRANTDLDLNLKILVALKTLGVCISVFLHQGWTNPVISPRSGSDQKQLHPSTHPLQYQIKALHWH